MGKKKKIPIERIEDKQKRHVCFSKRRKGLFKKAADLCDRGCEIAVVAISSAQNTFTFARPDLDQVLDRFLDEGRDQQPALVPHAEVLVQEEHDGEDEEAEDYVVGGSEKAEEEGPRMEEINGNNGVKTMPTEYSEDGPPEERTKMEREGCNNGGDDAKMAATAAEDLGDDKKVHWWNQPLDRLSREELMKLERWLSALRGMTMEALKRSS